MGVEQNEEGLLRGRQHLEHSTARAVKRGKLTEAEQAELLGRITLTTAIKDVADADCVVEAVVESSRSRRRSSASSTRSSARTPCWHEHLLALGHRDLHGHQRPGHVIGVHFFNPAPVQNLVEIVWTVVTEPTVLDDVKALVERLGKNPVVCGDKAGFIANTLLFGYLNHAVAMFEGRYASARTSTRPCASAAAT